MTLPDSIAYPEVSDSKYPYTPDGDRGFLRGQAVPRSVLLLARRCWASRRRDCSFNTFVVKLPIRHPVLVAKQVASVAAITNDRFGFGVGLSPWPEDYRLTGVAWEGRGKRMDEMLVILRGLLRGGYFAFDGEVFQIESIKICPTPHAAGAHPHGRSLGSGAVPGGEARGSGGCTAAATARSSRWHDRAARGSCAGSTAGVTSRSEIHVLSKRRVHEGRDPPARGSGRHRRHRGLPQRLRARRGAARQEARGDPPLRRHDDSRRGAGA